MTHEKQDQERADRDQERSEEAHWRVAEAGAEQEEETARPSDTEQEGWENRSGVGGREPGQTAEQGDESERPKPGGLHPEKGSER